MALLLNLLDLVNLNFYIEWVILILCPWSFNMFDNQKFLNDLYLYCSHRDIKFYELTYTEQLACIRSMLVCITRKQKI